MRTLLAVLVCALPLTVAADVVVPVDAVETFVNIRMSPEAGTEVVGHLSNGDELQHVASVPGWHEVEIAGGATGFVSDEWSKVVSEESMADAALDDVEAVAEEPTPTEDVAEEPADVAETVADVEETEAEPDEAVAATQTEVADDGAVTEEMPVEPEVEEGVVATEEPGEVEPVAEAEAVEELSQAEDVEDAAAEKPVEVSAVLEVEDEAAPAPESPAVVAGIPGPPGPQGPPGPPGPPGPAASGSYGGGATIEGSVDFLMKFTAPSIGGNSQIYDDGNKVGIGTAEPKQRLEVNGNIQIHERNSNVAGLIMTQSSGDSGYIMHNRANTLTIGAGSIDRITIDRDGNVGFGVARPNHPIEAPSGAYLSAGGVWTNSSSRDRKENIESLTPEEALAALAQLEPVRFNYRQDGIEEHVGFIAEDVPALVATSDRQSLSPMDIVAVLTKVVQAQQQQIAELEKRLGSDQAN